MNSATANISRHLLRDRVRPAVFICAFVCVQAATCLVTLVLSNQTEVTPESFARVGSAVKAQYPVFQDLSDTTVGRLVYEKQWADPPWSEWHQSAALVEYRRIYTPTERAVLLALAAVGVNVLFWPLWGSRSRRGGSLRKPDQDNKPMKVARR